MGYNIQQTAATFCIKKENKTKAFEAVFAITSKQSFPYSKRKIATLKEIMAEWRWKITLQETKTVEEGDEIVRTGDVIDISFEGEKIGDDSRLFEVLAPFVEPGSFIQMVGEDGKQWRWVFDGSTCRRIEPVLAWPV